jgi:hypothetical protein
VGSVTHAVGVSKVAHLQATGTGMISNPSGSKRGRSIRHAAPFSMHLRDAVGVTRWAYGVLSADGRAAFFTGTILTGVGPSLESGGTKRLHPLLRAVQASSPTAGGGHLLSAYSAPSGREREGLRAAPVAEAGIVQGGRSKPWLREVGPAMALRVRRVGAAYDRSKPRPFVVIRGASPAGRGRLVGRLIMAVIATALSTRRTT